jgi:hypothetical protein
VSERLAERFWPNVQIGATDECWPWLAGTSARGYGCFFVSPQASPRQQPAHRWALILSGVDVPTGMVIDHRCFNKLCCNPNHLRVATHQQNCWYSRPRSGQYKGVSWHQGAAKWQASIRVNRKSFGLGVFPTPEDAARAYDRAARQHFGEYAYLNFADQP